MSRALWRSSCVAGLYLLAAQAEAQPVEDPKFEVASIKVCKGSELAASPGRKGGRGGRGRVSGDPGRLSVECRSAANLIRDAYLEFASGAVRPGAIPEFSRRQLEQAMQGGPGWLESESYHIEAKAESPQSLEMMRGPMMRALLEDRFKLKLHRETKEVPVYVLVVAKGGPKLQAAKEGSCVSEEEFFAHPPPMPPAPGKPLTFICSALFRGADGRFAARHVTMAGLARDLSGLLDRDVVDKTGIGGMFDVEMQLLPADVGAGSRPDSRTPDVAAAPAPAPTDTPGASVFSGVQTLGLKLEPAKGAGVFLVIDHVERPSEN